MDDLVPFGSASYGLVLAFLLFSRGMDFLSTWIATPNLVLEANPIARKIGWRGGIILNIFVCVAFAIWPLPSVVITTTSLLVAARNFQSAWLMRSWGEEQYRSWMAERLGQANVGLFLFCLVGQALLVGGLGGVLMYFSRYASHRDLWHLIPFGVGMGIVTYALAVTVFSSLSLWRIRRSVR